MPDINKFKTTANTTIAVQCECPVLNRKYIGCIRELHFFGHSTVASGWLILGTRNSYIQVAALDFLKKSLWGKTGR